MKFFTIEEAEDSLPAVEKFLKKAMRLRDRIAWLLETNDIVLEVSSDEGFHYFVTEQIKANKQFHKLYYQFYGVIEQLNEIGVIVKDVDDGLVDFPFKMSGEDAFLSWRLGEEKIRYWHSCETEDRQLIVDVDELFQ